MSWQRWGQRGGVVNIILQPKFGEFESTFFCPCTCKFCSLRYSRYFLIFCLVSCVGFLVLKCVLILCYEWWWISRLRLFLCSTKNKLPNTWNFCTCFPTQWRLSESNFLESKNRKKSSPSSETPCKYFCLCFINCNFVFGVRQLKNFGTFSRHISCKILASCFASVAIGGEDFRRKGWNFSPLVFHPFSIYFWRSLTWLRKIEKHLLVRAKENNSTKRDTSASVFFSWNNFLWAWLTLCWLIVICFGVVGFCQQFS